MNKFKITVTTINMKGYNIYIIICKFSKIHLFKIDISINLRFFQLKIIK